MSPFSLDLHNVAIKENLKEITHYEQQFLQLSLK